MTWLRLIQWKQPKHTLMNTLIDCPFMSFIKFSLQNFHPLFPLHTQKTKRIAAKNSRTFRWSFASSQVLQHQPQLNHSLKSCRSVSWIGRETIPGVWGDWGDSRGYMAVAGIDSSCGLVSSSCGFTTTKKIIYLSQPLSLLSCYSHHHFKKKCHLFSFPQPTGSSLGVSNQLLVEVPTGIQHLTSQNGHGLVWGKFSFIYKKIREHHWCTVIQKQNHAQVPRNSRTSTSLSYSNLPFCHL